MKKSWTDDLAACLRMMLEPGALFDSAQAYRAEPVLRRLHPLFAGSIRDKIDEELERLGSRGDVAVLSAAAGVYRWTGKPAPPVRSRLETRSIARPSAASPPAAVTPPPAQRPKGAPGVLEFQDELRRRLAEAGAAGKEHIHVAAFDLYRGLAPFPAPNHNMPGCLEAMRAECLPTDQILTEPQRGQDGFGLLIRYMLPR